MKLSILVVFSLVFIASLLTWTIMLYILHEQYDRSLNRKQLLNNVAGKSIWVIIRLFVVVTCLFGIFWLLR